MTTTTTRTPETIIAERKALIPACVTALPDGTPIDWPYHYPRSEAYEAALTPLLPPGWVLYSVLDSEKHANDPRLGKDFGATRLDGRAHAFGIRDDRGGPRDIRATIPSKVAGRYVEDTWYFAAGDLPAACRWLDERLAEIDARRGL